MQNNTFNYTGVLTIMGYIKYRIHSPKNIVFCNFQGTLKYLNLPPWKFTRQYIYIEFEYSQNQPVTDKHSDAKYFTNTQLFFVYFFQVVADKKINLLFF